MFEAGLKDDKLALFYAINATNNVAEKTRHGITQRKTIKNIICQGDPWGSMQCSVQVDTTGRDSLAAELEPFRYIDQVEIPALGMVDDALTISESGNKTARMNAFINAKIAIRKLPLGPQKCFVLHTKKRYENLKKISNF